MKKSRYEYKSRKARLQMSLFSMVYHNSYGFLYTSSSVFRNIKKTEWGKLKNFNEAMAIIEDEYIKEVSRTLDTVVVESKTLGFNTTQIIMGHGDSFPTDIRFSTHDATPNYNMRQAYRQFVLRVGERLNLDFCFNFKYFVREKK